MRFRRSAYNWYDFIFAGIAAMIVFPDKIVGKIQERTERELGWFAVILTSVIGIGLMFLTMHLLMPHYPKLDWTAPLMWIGVFAVYRIIMSVVMKFFDFGD